LTVSNPLSASKDIFYISKVVRSTISPHLPSTSLVDGIDFLRKLAITEISLKQEQNLSIKIHKANSVEGTGTSRQLSMVLTSVLFAGIATFGRIDSVLSSIFRGSQSPTYFVMNDIVHDAHHRFCQFYPENSGTVVLGNRSVPQTRHSPRTPLHAISSLIPPTLCSDVGEPSNSSRFGKDITSRSITQSIEFLKVKEGMDYSKSTEENYQHESLKFYGKFTSIRATIDYNYHSNYIPSRQLLQDTILSHLLGKNNQSDTIVDKAGVSCQKPTNPWIVFTAGAMGAGKSYTIRHLGEKGRFPLDSFVMVDPDEIRRLLPEFDTYVEQYVHLAGEQTRKEAGLIAEILTEHALRNGKNVLVDGSLHDSDWYKKYFQKLRREYGEDNAYRSGTDGEKLRIGILHIMAPREAVFDRARERSIITGRVVPHEILEKSLEEVPKSVRILAPLVDFFAELYNPPNSEDIELVTEDMTWDSFRQSWVQTCSTKNQVRNRSNASNVSKL